MMELCLDDDGDDNDNDEKACEGLILLRKDWVKKVNWSLI